MFNLKQYLWKLIDYFASICQTGTMPKRKTFASKQVLLKTVNIGHEANTTRMILFFTFFIEEVYTTS